MKRILRVDVNVEDVGEWAILHGKSLPEIETAGELTLAMVAQLYAVKRGLTLPYDQADLLRAYDDLINGCKMASAVKPEKTNKKSTLKKPIPYPQD